MQARTPVHDERPMNPQNRQVQYCQHKGRSFAPIRARHRHHKPRLRWRKRPRRLASASQWWAEAPRQRAFVTSDGQQEGARAEGYLAIARFAATVPIKRRLLIDDGNADGRSLDGTEAAINRTDCGQTIQRHPVKSAEFRTPGTGCQIKQSRARGRCKVGAETACKPIQKECVGCARAQPPFGSRPCHRRIVP